MPFDLHFQVQASCEQAMRLWWEDFHPGWMIFTLGNRHFETLNQIIQYSQSTMLKGSLIPGDPNNIQVRTHPAFPSTPLSDPPLPRSMPSVVLQHHV